MCVFFGHKLVLVCLLGLAGFKPVLSLWRYAACLFTIDNLLKRDIDRGVETDFIVLFRIFLLGKYGLLLV